MSARSIVASYWAGTAALIVVVVAQPAWAPAAWALLGVLAATTIGVGILRNRPTVTWPWFLLAQPVPFPERMIGADPAGLLEHVFATWPSSPDAIVAESRDAYRRALTPPTIAAMCAASEWAIVDSNHGPPPYQSGALTD